MNCRECQRLSNLIHNDQIVCDQHCQYFEFNEESYFYKWIDQFQSDINSEIPIEILDKISSELGETEPTVQNIKKAMKDLRFQKYYGNIPYIRSRLLNRSPLKMTPSMKSNLKVMFRLIQVPYQRHHNNPYIKSPPSYALILSLLSDVIGYHELRDTVNPLRKWLGSDYYFKEIWKNICHDLEWPYRYLDWILS